MFDIVIVGSGLVGGAFIVDLAKRRPDFKIAIIEKNVYKKSVDDSFDSRIYAISPQNLNYLEKLLVYPDKRRLGTIERMEVYGDQKSTLILDSQQNRELYLSKTVEYKNLQDKLHTAISELDNVEIIYADIQDIQTATDHVVVMLSEQNIQTRLIVGADGANSIVRHKFEVPARLHDYGYSGVVANFTTELDHKDTAIQWFKDGTVLAFLPLTQNKISIVWSTNHYQELLAMDDKSFEEQVASFSDYQLGSLKLISKPVAFPLRLYSIDKVYASRMVLIGDAAHTIHPLAGQGVNLGFGDARELALLLSQLTATQLGDVGILRRYNASRIVKVRQMQLTCHYLHLFFKMDNSAISLIRNVGLNVVNNIPLLKKYLIKQAVSY